MPKYVFLSEEWMRAARALREGYRGKGSAPALALRMNLRISEVPFGDGALDAHLDTTSGEIELEIGHLDAADLTVGMDYGTAKEIFIEQNPQAGMQAFMAGRVRVDGDMTKLLAMQTGPLDPVAVELAMKIAEITE